MYDWIVLTERANAEDADGADWDECEVIGDQFNWWLVYDLQIDQTFLNSEGQFVYRDVGKRKFSAVDPIERKIKVTCDYTWTPDLFII
jgi:hypothetical protein